MRRCTILLAATVAALVHARAQTPPRTPPVQTFRTGADVVLVDVSIRDGDRAVTGLRAEDFVLTDNGVRQRIESIEATAVPIDVTLVVDVSGNPDGSWAADSSREIAAQLDAEVRRVAAMLRPGDRLRLLAVDTNVQQIFSMRPVSTLTPVLRVETGGLSALYDTLATALLQPVEPARRHVVIARTKGFDTISSIDAEAVSEIAAHSDALLHVVAMETALDNDQALHAFQCSLMGLCWPTGRSWIPFRRRLIGGAPLHSLLRDGVAIAEGAQATGGGLHQAAMLSEPTLTGTFRKAFEDFRNNYVLQYSPAAVPRTGWHAIEVRVPASRSYRVRARRGYLVEEEERAATPPGAAIAVPERPRTLPDFTLAYERGAYAQFAAGARQLEDPARLLREFEDRGNPWPAAPRKEATFALELVEPAVFHVSASTRTRGYDTIERFARLIRHPIDPDQFERYWHFAVLTLLEGTIRPTAAETHVARAIARFPDEPRFVLSRAIITDQRWSTRADASVVDAAGRPTPQHEEAVRMAYEAASLLPATSVEARIRVAFFVHRLGHHKEALRYLTQAGAAPIEDVVLRYLHQLFLGHVLWALGREGPALAAYRGALATIPSAQSARVALMNALLLSGNREAAEALAEQVQAEKNSDTDPWWMYWQGQYRFHPHAMARVREMSR